MPVLLRRKGLGTARWRIKGEASKRTYSPRVFHELIRIRRTPGPKTKDHATAAHCLRKESIQPKTTCPILPIVVPTQTTRETTTETRVVAKDIEMQLKRHQNFIKEDTHATPTSTFTTLPPLPFVSSPTTFWPKIS